MIMKLSFKTEKPTGKWKAFYTTHFYIKANGKVCGNIDSEDYKIRLMVVKKDINEDGNPNCKWKWVKLKHNATSVQDAKDFLTRNWSTVNELITLHTLDY